MLRVSYKGAIKVFAGVAKFNLGKISLKGCHEPVGKPQKIPFQAHWLLTGSICSWPCLPLRRATRKMEACFHQNEGFKRKRMREEIEVFLCPDLGRDIPSILLPFLVEVNTQVQPIIKGLELYKAVNEY